MRYFWIVLFLAVPLLLLSHYVWQPGRQKSASLRYPLSKNIRLLGPINDGKLRYLAHKQGQKEYIVIPGKDCHRQDQKLFCWYQGQTVTEATG